MIFVVFTHLCIFRDKIKHRKTDYYIYMCSRARYGTKDMVMRLPKQVRLDIKDMMRDGYVLSG